MTFLPPDPGKEHNLDARLTALSGLIGNGKEQKTLISRAYGFSLYQLETAQGRFAIKFGHGDVAGHLAIEAQMLRDLAKDGSLPVPQVLHSEDDLLVMEWVENDGEPLRDCHQQQAGEAFARLHATPHPYFGYPYDTTIGGLAQNNPQNSSWVEFFATTRLMGTALIAHNRGLLDAQVLARIEQLADKLADFLPEPAAPALVHGDAWHGNVLTRGENIAGLIDPALYYASPEVELAYVTMHRTFGKPFFEAYSANAAIEPGFFDRRIDVLNLYPNLVHLVLCGPSYLAPIVRTLDRCGL